MDKKELGKLGEFFSDKQNIEIKKELLATIHRNTGSSTQMSDEKLDKVVKMVRYTLQLYDLSSDMNKKINQMMEEDKLNIEE